MHVEEESASSVVSRTRLEFLVDGIFAIAMTLLVLDIHVPPIQDRRSTAELIAELGHDLPAFGSYLLSFLVLGVFWYRHNHSYRFFRRISAPMLALQLLQAACAAFFPFCASLIGHYPSNALSLVVYAGCIFMYVWISLLLWITAWKAGGLAHDLSEEAYRSMRKRHLRSCAGVTCVFTFALSRFLA